MAQDRKQPSAQAGIRFEKAQKQAREGEQAWAEYEATGRAADVNRARLKALRLAKEAQEAADKEAEPAPKKAASKKASPAVKEAAASKKASAAPKKAAPKQSKS